MPWCPKCKTEYRDGFTICLDCGEDLVDELDDKKKKRYRAARKREKPQDVFLVNVFDPIEFSYMTSMLEEAGIAYRISEEGSGQYMQIFLGQSFAGKNIMVSKEDFDIAADIVRSYHADTE